MPTKEDRINEAYSELRISGITKGPTAAELSLALSRMETMMRGFLSLDMEMNYNFEGTSPALGSSTGLDRMFWTHVSTNLAIRLPDFNKTIHEGLAKMATAGLSFMGANTAILEPNRYPSRMPLGEANTLRRGLWQTRYYSEAERAPLTSATQNMIIGDIEDFTEDLSDYVLGTETVDSFTIEADDGLDIVTSSLVTPLIRFRVDAVGNDDNNPPNSLQQIKIVAVTSTGRETTRIWNFRLRSAENIPQS